MLGATKRQWDTMFCPDVHESLEAYINGEWRNDHDLWVPRGDKKALVNGPYHCSQPRQTLNFDAP